MSFLKTRRKKIIALISTIFTLGVICPTSLLAATGDAAAILAAIKVDTGNLLAAVNTIPAHIDTFATNFTQFAIQWTGPDSSSTTAELQSNFAKLSNVTVANAKAQSDLQQQLINDFATTNEITSSTLPYANDLIFQSMMGQSLTSSKGAAYRPSSGYGYIKNASGLNIKHSVPPANWPSTPTQARYVNYFNAIMAAQTFNGYVLSQLYTDTLKEQDGVSSDLQKSLMTQASNSDWFTLVGSEYIGLVLRQILMYNSQIFVLMTQLLQIQKQSLAAQAMTNTLLILGNQFTETQLLQKAQATN
jgi:hypothetical protein